jgi:hypothetical protein
MMLVKGVHGFLRGCEVLEGYTVDA